MPVSRTVSLLLLLGVLAAPIVPALAADALPQNCLTKAEQRAAIAGHKAIRLAEAIRSVHRHGRRGEVLRARLCRRGERLDYVLTLLTRNGKVTRVTVDAANGELINGT